MKSILILSIFFALSAEAASLSCKANGSTFGVTKIEALNSGNTVYSQITVRQSKGDIPQPVFTVKGDLNHFQIAPSFYSGPFGIKDVYLTKLNGNYVLKTITFCNFYYQEETCMDGDILEESIDTSVTCTNAL